MYLLFFNYNNMRTWLTETEQKKINDVYGGYSPSYKHVHMCFSHTNSLDNISYEFDLVLTQNTTLYNDLHFGTSNYYRVNTKLSYRSWTLEQMIDLLPSTIYCDNEYNAVNIDETKNYHILKLHIIKQKDENKDIDYMYKVLYKPINTKGIYKHIKIKKHEFKDPELEGDELISLVYDLMLWCISHGHLPSANKN